MTCSRLWFGPISKGKQRATARHVQVLRFNTPPSLLRQEEATTKTCTCPTLPGGGTSSYGRKSCNGFTLAGWPHCEGSQGTSCKRKAKLAKVCDAMRILPVRAAVALPSYAGQLRLLLLAWWLGPLLLRLRRELLLSCGSPPA